MSDQRFRSPHLTRRELIHLLGVSAGFGFFSTSSHGEASAAGTWQGSASSANKVIFPKGAIVRTLLKDMAPEALATRATLFHEHFSIDLPPINPAPSTTPRPPNPTKDVALMIEEAKLAMKDGVGCIVDGGHTDMGRDLDLLRKVTTESGLPIVASGGYYMQRTYPPEIATQSEDQIADGLAREAAAKRFGAFGEIGENPDAPMSDVERKVFRAVGRAHVRTNLPIFTHNAYGTGPNVPKDAGLRQLDVLESVGVKPQRVAIGHTCCLDDPSADLIKQIAKRGAFVGFDRATGGLVPDDKKVVMVLAFLEAGYADRLLICSDFTGRRTPARPGYANTLTVFIPRLRAAGVNDAVLHQIMYDNPRRFLAFVPKRST